MRVYSGFDETADTGDHFEKHPKPQREDTSFFILISVQVQVASAPSAFGSKVIDDPVALTQSVTSSSHVWSNIVDTHFPNVKI